MIIGWLLILGAVVVLVVAIASRFKPRHELKQENKALYEELRTQEALMVRVVELCMNSPFDENPLRIQVLDEIRQARVGGRNELEIGSDSNYPVGNLRGDGWL